LGSYDLTRPLRISLAVTIGAILAGAVLLVAPHQAHADYTPPTIPDYLPIGPNGGRIANLSTPVNVSDAATKWNQWTGTSKMSSGSTSGCGASIGCIVFALDGNTVFINSKSCAVPDWSAPTWATVYMDAGAYFYNICNGTIGSAAKPVFVVAFNNELTFNATQLLHIGRHETAHGLNLGDAPSTIVCWQSGSTWYPLMKNNATNCPQFGTNVTASPNEALTAKQRNGW